MSTSHSEPSKQEPDKSKEPTVSSLELLGGHRQLIIRHGRDQYRLSLTSSNKLILTK
jgi:hemin uptake protein HemP